MSKRIARWLRMAADKIDPRPDFPPRYAPWLPTGEQVEHARKNSTLTVTDGPPILYHTVPAALVEPESLARAKAAARSYADEVEKIRQEQLNDAGGVESRHAADDHCRGSRGGTKLAHSGVINPPNQTVVAHGPASPLSNIEPVSLKRAPGIKKRRKLQSVPDSDGPKAA